MNIDSSQLLMMLQWSDSAFPTGAFAHSGGLETYTQSGQVENAAQLAALIQVKLENAARTDLIVVHLAHRAFVADDVAQLAMLDELCCASKVARETRQASERVGRRMLDNVLLVHPDVRLSAYRAAIIAGQGGHHAVVHGAAYAALGLDARAALLAFGFGIVANQASAALKLLAMGQTQAQTLITGMQPHITTAVDIALTRTLDDFGGFAPGLELRAMQHEGLFRRLFIS
ncbi:MAG: urease accessory protein UreF [Anaerolineae bacterium]|nr:urease accessory protein UreF [Anaerolineae bacterium]